MVVNRSETIDQLRKNHNGFPTLTMKFWERHNAAKKRSKAQRDILLLLRNSRPRQPKNKKTQPVTRKQFGILANSISFKVVRETNDEQSPNCSETEEQIDHISRPKKRTEGKINSTTKNQGFDVIDLPEENKNTKIIQNIEKDQPQKVNPSKKVNGKRRARPSKKDTRLNVLQEKAPQSEHSPKFRNNNDSGVHTNNERLNVSDTLADFEFDASPQTGGIYPRELPFGSLSEPNFENGSNSMSGSIGFNELENQIGAGHSNCLADFSENPLDNRNIRRGNSIEIQSISSDRSSFVSIS